METTVENQKYRASCFFRSDVNDAVDEVDSRAELFQDRENFIRAVILELEKLTK